MDIKGDWKKRAVCGLMVLVMALSLLPTSILAADTRSVTDNAIKNGSFEQPAFNDKSSPQWAPEPTFDWKTTASDHLIEFGSTRKYGTVPHIWGKPHLQDDGYQFAELNADEESTLYQYATTVGGNVYEWGLSHRGRSGIDRMALIIGPKQDVDPAKPSKNGKDQFMRMTDWVRQHALDMGVTVSNMGCTQKITVYSKKFSKNGGFENDIGDAFSASPSDVYTEKWNVWIIGTNNDAWGNYGTNSSAYAAGKLAYSCRYAVPDGQMETVFAFCSYSAAGGSTQGNLIDNIHFSLYQTITAAATAGGSGFIGVPTGNVSEYYPIGSSMSELVVANGSTIKVKAVKPKDSNVQFVGAYVTRQTAKGLEQVFIPVADKGWREEGDTYTYEHRVEEPADIVLVFVKKPMVIYEANGGDRYTYGDNGTNAVSFAPQVSGDGSTTARGPYDSKEATPVKDGWRFDGWLLPQKNKVLPAVHTVSYDAERDTFTFAANSETTELKSGGATLIAQWKWRQCFVTASRMKGEGGTVSDKIQENTECGSITVKSDGAAVTPEKNGAVTDYYSQANEKITATAAANNGYRFVGWYQQLDGDKYEFVSNQAAYTYTAKAEGVQTIYARFAPTHTVTYQWIENLDECPTEAELKAEGMDLPAAATVMDGDNYPISTVYKADETSIPGTKQENGVTLYGKWKFTGWRDEKDDIRKVNLANVRNDRTLTGKWTFTPNTKFTLAYQVAENSNWTPSNLSAPAAEKQYFRTEPVTAASAPTYTQGELYVDQELTLKGTWTFGGWRRSDTNKTVAAGGEFNMPGNDVTLTGQWSFIPNTYTVLYNIGNGAGTVPEPHNSYDYSALAEKSGCDTTQSGIPFGASITLRNFTGTAPEGTYFAGWSLVDPTNADLATIETQDPGDSVGFRKLGVTQNGQEVRLYAVYKNKDVATVDFAVNDSNWGDVNTKSGSFTVRDSAVDAHTVSSTATPRDGYHFVGWYEKSDDGELKPVSESAINDATLTVTAAMMQEKLKPHTESGGENGTPVLEVRYVAKFEPNTFTIQYDANYPADVKDKSGQMENQPFSANASRNLNANQFQCKGYTFDGWTTEKNGTGVFYSDGAAFTQTVEHNRTVTLYAKWEKLSDVTITYTAYPDSLGEVALNSGISQETAVQAAGVSESTNPETGTLFGATATPHEGIVFAGWYNDLTKEKVGYSETFVPQQQGGRYVSASYEAYFRPQRYTLTFDTNGGVGEMEPQTFEHGQILPLNGYRFSRDGYDFVGWALSKDGEKRFDNKAEVWFTDLVSSGSKLEDGAKATLYAVWQERDVTLNYASSDESLGTVTAGSETIGAATGKPTGSTAQAKSGARFDGWYSADGTLLSTKLTFVPTKADGVWQGTTYYARFSAQRRPSTPSTPAKPDDTKITLAPIPEMLNGKDHYAYLLGYEDGTVRPNGNISRAEVATVLFRLLKDDVRTQNLTKDNAYSDVPDTAWYSTAVSTLSKMGVISGYPDGTFRPNAPITRAEFAAMIARFDETAKSADTPFTDISGHWAENAIGKAYGNGWVEGSSKTVFCPESNLTRAETATLLNRVLHRLPEKESDLLANQIAWPDNPETFWGYLTIQEATNSHEYERKADGVHETQTAKRENRDWSKEFEQ